MRFLFVSYVYHPPLSFENKEIFFFKPTFLEVGSENNKFQERLTMDSRTTLFFIRKLNNQILSSHLEHAARYRSFISESFSTLTAS